jgi:hypothetical protein
MNPFPGRGRGGFGRGRGGGFGGGGRGWRHRYYATGLTGWQRGGRGWGGFPPPGAFEPPPVSREEELQRLRGDLQCLEESAERMRHRIAELSTEPQTSEA